MFSTAYRTPDKFHHRVSRLHLTPPPPNKQHFTFTDDILKWFFCGWKVLCLIRIALNFVPKSPIESALGQIMHGLAPNRRQAITWTNADPVHWRSYVVLCGDESLRPCDVLMRQYNKSSLVQLITCRLFSSKPWSEPMLALGTIFIEEKAFENVVCKMVIFLSRQQCVIRVVPGDPADCRYDNLRRHEWRQSGLEVYLNLSRHKYFWSIMKSLDVAAKNEWLDGLPASTSPFGYPTIQSLHCSHLYTQTHRSQEALESPSWCFLSWTPHRIFPDLMMTSSNVNIFRVTGHLYGEFTGPRWIPHTKASDAELWWFLWSAPE